MALTMQACPTFPGRNGEWPMTLVNYYYRRLGPIKPQSASNMDALRKGMQLKEPVRLRDAQRLRQRGQHHSVTREHPAN